MLVNFHQIFHFCQWKPISSHLRLSFIFTLLYFLPGNLCRFSLCSKYEVIVFDSYGTLFDVNSLVNNTGRILTSTNPATVVNLWRKKQLDYTWLRSLMKSPERDSYTDFWEVTKDALKYSLEKLEISATQSQQDELMFGWLTLALFPDVKIALHRIKKKYRLAILSNGTPRMLRDVVKCSGLDDLFDSSNEISVDAVRVFKPNPAVYALGQNRLHIPKSKILFVSGNHWDVVGAKSYGFPSVWINRQNDPQEKLDLSADLEFSDLNQLSNYLS